PSCKDIFYMENNKVYQYDGNISKSLDYIQQRPNYICPADNGDYIFISESILGENLNIVYNSGQISNLINNLDFKTQSIAYVREKNLILILQRSILSYIFITLYLYEGKRIIPNSTNKIFTYKLTEEKAKYYNKIDYYKQGSDDNEDNRSKNEYILISDKCASNILVYQLDLMNDPKPLLSKIKIDSYEIEDFENIGNDILIIANNLKYKIDLGSYHTTFEKINTNDKIRKLIKYIPNDNDNGTIKAFLLGSAGYFIKGSNELQRIFEVRNNKFLFSKRYIVFYSDYEINFCSTNEDISDFNYFLNQCISKSRVTFRTKKYKNIISIYDNPFNYNEFVILYMSFNEFNTDVVEFNIDIVEFDENLKNIRLSYNFKFNQLILDVKYLYPWILAIVDSNSEIQFINLKKKQKKSFQIKDFYPYAIFTEPGTNVFVLNMMNKKNRSYFSQIYHYDYKDDNDKFIFEYQSIASFENFQNAILSYNYELYKNTSITIFMHPKKVLILNRKFKDFGIIFYYNSVFLIKIKYEDLRNHPLNNFKEPEIDECLHTTNEHQELIFGGEVIKCDLKKHTNTTNNNVVYTIYYLNKNNERDYEYVFLDIYNDNIKCSDYDEKFGDYINDNARNPLNNTFEFNIKSRQIIKKENNIFKLIENKVDNNFLVVPSKERKLFIFLYKTYEKGKRLPKPKVLDDLRVHSNESVKLIEFNIDNRDVDSYYIICELEKLRNNYYEQTILYVSMHGDKDGNVILDENLIDHQDKFLNILYEFLQIKAKERFLFLDYCYGFRTLQKCKILSYLKNFCAIGYTELGYSIDREDKELKTKIEQGIELLIKYNLKINEFVIEFLKIKGNYYDNKFRSGIMLL
ncbi:MAG: hypothetical protein QXD43_04990, partial [Candidatus Aenigmatarchaeota archaeon]